jgi:sugar lactone lactonase YvrE
LRGARSRLRLPAAALSLLALAALLHAAQPQFWRIEGARDFLEGELDGLSVDSEGRVRLAPAARLLHDPEAPHVWCLARDGKGRLYAGTGNDGRVYRVEKGPGALFYDSNELEVHALSAGPDGRLYAGTSPDGKVYAIDDSGKAETFFDPSDKYIWALAFDDKGRLYVATGGEGRIYRVEKDGKAQSVLSSSETHITALAAGPGGVLYAGSSPGGILYRIDAEARVFVLHDSSYREVKALDCGPDGSLYAALIDGQPKEEAPSAPAVTTPAPTVGAEITITESTAITTVAAAPSEPAPAARATPEPSRAGAPKGAMLRVSTGGEVDTLWTSSDDTPHALLALPRGALLGTGDKGKLYEVRDDRSWSMVVAFDSEQVTALARGDGSQTLVATANPGRLHALAAAPGPSGTFTSKPKDTETVSGWGRLRWEASVPEGTSVEIQTRSGNTGTPDSTWSAWSEVYKERSGSPVSNERARFLQVRALLSGQGGVSPLLDSVTAPYLQRNLRPQVLSVNVHSPGEVFQKPLAVSSEVEILGLDSPEPGELRPGARSLRSTFPTTTYSRRLYQRGLQTFTWKAEDPNNDGLSYDVHYRPVGESRFRLLRQGLTEAVLAWDTSSVPNGRYLIRVTASDAPTNPHAQALTGDKESAPFDVDNTPPGVAVLLAERSPVRVRATVIDDSSLVRKAEYSVDGGRWEEVHPVDGINDAREESYEFSPRLTPPGPHIVIVRATDLLGNVATARIEVP